MKASSIILVTIPFIFALILANNISVDAHGTKIGKWRPFLSVSDPHVVEIAEFAVAEYNKKEGKSYELEKIYAGNSKKVDQGVKCRLFIAVKLEGQSYDYGADVLEMDHAKTLVSFIPTNRIH